jgi:cyclopropane-fatty-acyl-phospholipid synthase
VRAITSLDQIKFADAYLAGDIDIDGDMLRPFELRRTMGDLHPLMTAWRFLQPLLLGQVRTNRAAIISHYDIGAVLRKHSMWRLSGSSITVSRGCD